MKKLLFLLAIISASAFAIELPVDETMEPAPGAPIDYKSDAQPVNLPEFQSPVSSGLEELTQAERENSIISIESSTQNLELVAMASQIEQKWNQQKFNDAIGLMKQLESQNPQEHFAIGLQWRNPIESNEISMWGTDVRIGTRDSIYVVSSDVHYASGHIFAILLYHEGSQYKWSVNMSTNMGNSWTETYVWFAGFYIHSVSATIAANHCYVGYDYLSTTSSARIRRFRASDGLEEDFHNGETFIDAISLTLPDSVMEIAMASNQDYFNNRIYLSLISSQGNLEASWSDSGVNWTSYSYNISDASHGLDITCNQGYSTYYSYLSYISTSNRCRIFGLNGEDSLFSFVVGSAGDYSAISAYDDTVFCVSEFSGNPNFYCKYWISYNGGTSWAWGALDDTVTYSSESPDVTLRGGAGISVTYRYYTSTREQRYRHRTYAFQPWPTAVSIADNEPYYNKPSINYLGGNNYGVVYLCWDNPYLRAAYFDKAVAVGIEELNPLPVNYTLEQNYPNPFNASTLLKYYLPSSGNVTLEIYDLVGRRVASLVNENQNAGYHSITWNAESFSSGIYFAKISAGDFTASQKMVLMK